MNTEQTLDDFLFHDFCRYDMKPDEWPEIAHWCERTFGASNWGYHRGVFSFSEEGYAAIFLLRWL